MKIHCAFLSAILASLLACSTSDSGTGLNTVERSYGRPTSEVWDAAVSAAKSFEFTVDDNRHDKMGGEIVARRASGDRVNMKVRSVDSHTTSVSIRVEPGNRNFANQIHDRIAAKVGPAVSRVDGDATIDSTYTVALGKCALAAEAACKSVSLQVVGKDIREKSGVVDAKDDRSATVRILLDQTGEMTRVTFCAGDGSEARALTTRLKAEFDRQLAVAAR